MGKTKVLVVDDEAGVRRIIRRVLEAVGCQVIETDDGADAAELARRERPEVVLLDIHMPRLDGIAAIEEIRAAAPGARVFVVSGDPLPGRAALAAERGAAGFLSKPFDLPALRRMVVGRA